MKNLVIKCELPLPGIQCQYGWWQWWQWQWRWQWWWRWRWGWRRIQRFKCELPLRGIQCHLGAALSLSYPTPSTHPCCFHLLIMMMRTWYLFEPELDVSYCHPEWQYGKQIKITKFAWHTQPPLLCLNPSSPTYNMGHLHFRRINIWWWKDF